MTTSTNIGSTSIIMRKLNQFDAVDIRRAALAGASTAELAQRYGVGVHAIRGVLRYASHVPELTAARLETLAKAALARGLTLDDALDAVLAEARR
jgi:hypothetical protein